MAQPPVSTAARARIESSTTPSFRTRNQSQLFSEPRPIFKNVLLFTTEMRLWKTKSKGSCKRSRCGVRIKRLLLADWMPMMLPLIKQKLSSEFRDIHTVCTYHVSRGEGGEGARLFLLSRPSHRSLQFQLDKNKLGDKV
jgi:hypothetical protein